MKARRHTKYVVTTIRITYVLCVQIRDTNCNFAEVSYSSIIILLPCADFLQIVADKVKSWPISNMSKTMKGVASRRSPRVASIQRPPTTPHLHVCKKSPPCKTVPNETLSKEKRDRSPVMPVEHYNRNGIVRSCFGSRTGVARGGCTSRANKFVKKKKPYLTYYCNNMHYVLILLLNILSTQQLKDRHFANFKPESLIWQ